MCRNPLNESAADFQDGDAMLPDAAQPNPPDSIPPNPPDSTKGGGKRKNGGKVKKRKAESSAEEEADEGAKCRLLFFI
jgi:hypothetical protein